MRASRGLAPRPLRRHRDFLWLLGGQSVSEVGSQVTLLALPLAAIDELHAANAAVGFLRFCETLPFLLVGLPAGAWIDRARRRPVMVGASVGRAAVIGSIPLVFALGDGTLGQLFAASLVAGALAVLFDVAYQAYLPRLVSRDQLVDANAALTVSQSGAVVVGPAVGGVLVHALGAAWAVAADAASFVVSALTVAAIRAPEEAPEVRSDRPGLAASRLHSEVGEGVRFVMGHPVLRLLAGATATYNLFFQAFETVLLIFLARTLALPSGRIGLILAIGSLGYLAGAAVAGRLGRLLGIGPVCVAGLVLCAVPSLAVAFAHRSDSLWLVAAALLLSSFGVPVYNVNQVSLRQAVCPDRLQGRMNATMRFFVWGTLPAGSLLGGALSSAWTVRATLWLCGGASLLAAVWALPGPVRRLRVIPAVGATGTRQGQGGFHDEVVRG